MALAPFRKVRLGSRAVEVRRNADGTILLQSPEPLGAYPQRVTERLVHWAERAPDRTFIAKRDASGAWRKLSYAETLRSVQQLAQALLDRKLSDERPLAILSGNDVEHALLALAAMHIGVPYAPISPAYSLVSKDLAKLRYILELLNPGLVFAADGQAFARAIDTVVPRETELAVTRNPPASRAATSFDELLATAPTEALERTHRNVGPDAIAKFLFTSGSTGQPKGVINTHRMLCANQQMILQSMPFIGDEPPVLVDWLPWNHTFGGNHNIGIALFNGGTLYIDDGRPLPGQIEHTVANLREIAPTMYFNVPKGFEMLIPYLDRDRALRERFFSRVAMLFYAGAGLSQHGWDELDRLATEACGERILMITGLGATETAPSVTFANWEAGRSGIIGLPAPGQEVKLAPVGAKLEIRVRGPNITPGYWRAPDVTRAAFDEQGFYRMGDAVRFVDPNDAQKGLLFDGRIAEDFKLATGTWVSVGPLRANFLTACAPFVQDVVIAGPDRDDVAVLIFPNVDACRGLCPELGAAATANDVLRHPAVRARFQTLLDRLAVAATGSANRIVRAIVLDTPPSLDVGEVTDKGSINQRAVLAHRAAIVDELYAEAPSPRTLVADTRSRSNVA
jgi:feruloyl-CoA synthase